MNTDPAWELADPRTPPARLHELAAQYPQLGPQIAAHPNCYPELQQWIASMQATPTALAQASQIKKRSGWKLFAIAAAVLVPLITVASVAIPLIANIGERGSSADTLKVIGAPAEEDPFADAEVIGEAKPQPAGDTDWLIPVSAPIETFPDTPVLQGTHHDMYTCSDEQIEWLDRHAIRASVNTSREFSITLHNSASSGASLPIGNIRFEGKEVPSEPLISFQCPAGGRGVAGGGQPLMVRTDGSEAVYGEAVGASGEDVEPVGSPVTINLAPGEVSVITLTRDESVGVQRRYEGRFVADLIDGSGRTVILADDIVFSRAPLIGFYVGYATDGSGEGNFLCRSESFYVDGTNYLGEYKKASAPCSPTQAAAIFEEARLAAPS